MPRVARVPMARYFCRHKFADEKVFVARLAVFRVDVERRVRVWRDDHELLDLAALAQVVDQRRQRQQRLRVLAQSVQVINHGEALGFIRVERRRQRGTETDRVREDRAFQRGAFEAALGERRNDRE